jgi:hypothetical protein
MKINLLDIPVYYINLEKDVTKNQNILNVLNNLGFKNIIRVDAISHEKGTIVGCARSHHKILQSKPAVPFIIIEDDCVNTEDFISEIDVLDDSDAIYLGISKWGRYLNWSGPYIHYSFTEKENIVKIYNMLSTHAILYTSQEYVDVCSRASKYFGYEIEDHVDIAFAEIQKFYNVYAFNKPFFYQSDYNQDVTSGVITEFALPKSKALDFYNNSKSPGSIEYKELPNLGSGGYMPTRIV